MSESPTHPDTFVRRHIGPSPDDIQFMLKELGYKDLSDISKSIVPSISGIFHVPNCLIDL